MSTVVKIVTRALRILDVVDASEAPTASDFETAVEALNGMMRRWEANGLALGWQDVSHAEEDLPAPPEAEQAIAFNLALVLRPEYLGVTLGTDVYQIAADGLSALRRDMLVANPLVVRARRPRCARYNIATDEYGDY